MADDVYEWTRRHVQARLEEAFKLLGAETGKLEKRLREAITAEHSANRKRLDEQRDAYAELLLGHRETIDALMKRVRELEARLVGVESMFARPAEATPADRRRLS
jgi:1,6-anhydro-N-acetylmuramate kinase